MILVLNSGSSSLKFKIFNQQSELQLSGRIEEIGPGENSTFKIKAVESFEGQQNFADHKQALQFLLAKLEGLGLTAMKAIGHRVVHGGDKFQKETLVTSGVLAEIEDCIPLAPLHNPANLTGIKAAGELFPGLPQVAVFDTSFHSTMPGVAKTYAIPYEYTEEGYRRYGFHGISHEFITRRLAAMQNKTPDQVSLVSCHLGNGASLCAVKNGKSIDTTMGYTPLEGLVMGTRCGDIDAGLLFALAADKGKTLEDLNTELNKKSGLLGLSGIDNDMRAILADQGERATLALDVYCYRLAKHIASYSALLGKEAAIVFTAGVGENSAEVRKRTIENLPGMSLKIDEKKNESGEKDIMISAENSQPVYVIATNEERLIAEKTMALLQ